MKTGKLHAIGNWFYFPVIILAVIGILLSNHSITVISEGLIPDRGPCIIIDAGHGGEDGGATSCTGVLESGINLEVALRLNDLFHFLGFETKMIRQTDTSIHTQGDTIAARKRSDLKQRVAITNETENALVISIHQNNYPDGRYSGAQVFYADTEGSETLAKHIQGMFTASLTRGSNRRAKQATGVYFMNHITCTGILIECGFLSNPEEEAKLRSSGYQKKICCVIATSVSTYIANT